MLIKPQQGEARLELAGMGFVSVRDVCTHIEDGDRMLSYLLTLLLFGGHLWSQAPRSTFEMIFGPDLMTPSQSLGLVGPNGEIRRLTLRSRLPGALLKNDKRSIVLIESGEQLNDLPDPLQARIREALYPGYGLGQSLVFANFAHASPLNPEINEFYVAVLPGQFRVEKVIYQIEWFGAGVGAHAQIRFVLDTPMRLIPQQSDTYPVLSLDKADLIYSLQALRAENGEATWDPLRGLLGEYANALQVFSTESKARSQISQSVVENYEITGLSENQKRQIFMEALRISHREQETGLYNTVFNSCITQSLIPLKKVIPNIRTAHFNPYSLKKMIESATGQPLVERGTLNEEFADLVRPENLMTREKIQRQAKFQMLKELLPVLERPEFDQVVREVAEILIESGVTYPEVAAIYQKWQSQGKLNLDGQTLNENLRLRIRRAWESRFPGEPLQKFFTLLAQLQSQNP